MVLNTNREDILAADLAKIRATTRMRLGIVAGVVIIGAFQTNFSVPAGADIVTAARIVLRAAMPVIFIGIAGILVVLGVARRDMKKVQAEYESKQFRVPRRKSRK